LKEIQWTYLLIFEFTLTQPPAKFASLDICEMFYREIKADDEIRWIQHRNWEM